MKVTCYFQNDENYLKNLSWNSFFLFKVSMMKHNFSMICKVCLFSLSGKVKRFIIYLVLWKDSGFLIFWCLTRTFCSIFTEKVAKNLQQEIWQRKTFLNIFFVVCQVFSAGFRLMWSKKMRQTVSWKDKKILWDLRKSHC